jgi:glycosyltransferase involved in cell wall biosynthesis/GT2 family glycosyltransferase
VATPLVSVVLAARDAEGTVAEAVGSVMRQTIEDLELVVVDDGSVDGTGDVLAAIGDERIRVLRNETPLGLAGALNVGLDVARGTYVARMDADDVALPHWLERVVGRIRSLPSAAVVGAGTIDLHSGGTLGSVHRMPVGPRAIRWAALFSSPFFHPTVVVDRAVLERHGLRYDTSFDESEDYDLWARILALADGDNVPEALVLYRRHEGQASTRRAELQLECRRRVALREIERLVPDMTVRRAELAWRAGGGLALPAGTARQAVGALHELAEAFEARHGGRDARRAAAWALARRPSSAMERGAFVRAAVALDPALPVDAVRRISRRRSSRGERVAAERLLQRAADGRVRVTMVLPEPTPYRTGMLDRLGERPDLDLTVVYAAAAVQQRAWGTDVRHRAVLLDGRRVPGAARVLRHDYPLSTGIFGALGDADPDVVVVSGWSTFASQATVAWCRRHGVPYVLLVESNERDARPGWRRTVKSAVVPTVVGGAAEVLVVGSLARESMRARGVPDERISVVANTVDVAGLAEAADALAPARGRLRTEAGIAEDDVVVLSVGRLAPEKGHDTLVRAAAAAAEPRIVVALAGSGPERERLAALAAELGVRLVLLPDVPWERIVERYALADVFALLSRHEPWGVVVNEAAACGLPLVLSDRVGAGYDLLEDGRNGRLVPVDDAAAAADAFGELAADPELRRAMGSASLEVVAGWGYEPSIERLLEVVQRVASRQPASASA